MKLYDPNILTLREVEQNPAQIAEYAEWCAAAAEEVYPITILCNAEELLVIDGHHRARGAVEAGSVIPGVEIGAADYNRLTAAGYDDIEISFALLYNDHTEAAYRLDSQFGGANVARRGLEALELLEA